MEMTKVLHDGRREGAKRFYIAGVFNIEFGMLCTGEDEDEELCDKYGPQCWQGCDADPGGLKTTMWSEVMKSSTADRFCKIQRSWRSEERCSAVRFGTVMVMSVYAPDPGKDEKFIKEVTKVLQDGRRAGARHFFIAGDLDVGLGVLRAGVEDDQELRDMYGPQCWLWEEAHQGFFLKKK